ncbi:MAG: SagB/ThcOx family dehydrogenase [Muribaculum sp.]|nr:SagB/ThcOx family dehydrogenase [Muribaculaceae bacterium]MCM1081074.1 SagB/ThcOx family dehydrogenase [Muribaculum sp.]
MKKLFSLTMALVASVSIYAQNINLPEPATTGGLPVNKALAVRHSVRNFDSSKALSMQTVSNLLWAACGINRAQSNMRTNPTARNFQEIDAYWFDQNGVYRYDPKQNLLIEITKGDYRSLIAGAKFKQEFVLDAPASIVLVADTTKPGMTAALIDAGIACENINIFCAGNGLATVPRMTMDNNAIQKLLSLPDTSLPVLNNPIGYEK